MKKYVDYEKVFIDKAIEAGQKVDYLNRNSIRKHDRALDQYRKAAETIKHNFPENIINFTELMSSDDERVRLCCAICIMDLFHPLSKSIEQKAIDLVFEYCQKHRNEVETVGFDIWLREAREKFQSFDPHSEE